MDNKAYNRIINTLDYGRLILDIEDIVNATKYTKKSDEVTKIMKEIKLQLVDDMINYYNTDTTVDIVKPKKTKNKKTKAAKKTLISNDQGKYMDSEIADKFNNIDRDDQDDIDEFIESEELESEVLESKGLESEELENTESKVTESKVTKSKGKKKDPYVRMRR